MLKLEALYISAFVTFVLASSAYSGWRAIEGPFLPWVGALLTTLPSALFVVRIYTIGGADRTILFSDLTDNYRVRPEPDTFLAVFEGRRPTPATA